MSPHSPTADPNQPSRRIRVSRACVACQQKKQKVLAVSLILPKPQALTCLSVTGRLRLVGIVVEPTEVPSFPSLAGGTLLTLSFAVCVSQDPSTKRRHPRGYIEYLEHHNSSLENHVASLEQTISELQPHLALDELAQEGSSWHEQDHNALVPIRSEESVETSFRASDPSPSATCTTSAREQSQQADNANEDLSNLELLCLRSAGAEPHFFGATFGYPFGRIFSASLKAVRQQAPGLSVTGIVDETFHDRPRPAPAPLPNRTIVSMLTTAYFEQVHPQFPFLHRPSYQEREDQVLSDAEAGKTPNPIHAFFVYILCSIGALTGPLAGASLPQGLYMSAENLLDHVMQQNSLESIQAILCCAVYSMRSPVGVSIWTLSGMALRQCIELGLHRKIRWATMESNILKNEMRKRVFWCSYNLDRAVAMTLGRPVGISDCDVTVEHFADINDEDIAKEGFLEDPRTLQTEPSTTVSCALHTIRLRQLWGRIQNEVHPQVTAEASKDWFATTIRFKKELNLWLESSPPRLASSNAKTSAFGGTEWFSLMYHHTVHLLYRYRVVNNPDIETAPIVYTECAHSAQAITMIYRQLYVSQRLNDTWGALHTLFLGAVTFLHCLWVSAETRELYRHDKVSAICTSTLIVLAIMTERWSAVEAYRDCFEVLSRETQTMLAELASATSAPHLPMISSGSNDQFYGYLSHMNQVGMCSSVEELLASMVE